MNLTNDAILHICRFLNMREIFKLLATTKKYWYLPKFKHFRQNFVYISVLRFVPQIPNFICRTISVKALQYINESAVKRLDKTYLRSLGRHDIIEYLELSADKSLLR